jgi:hypothetical protein
MKPGELLTQVGHALFGERWKADIERALNIRPGRADDWSKGHGEPPPGVWLELARIISDRRKALPTLEAEVLAFGQRPPPRIYKCANGRKFSVKADADGSYPEVYFQVDTGNWEALIEGEQTLPPQATAFRFQRGQEVGHVRPIVPKYSPLTKGENW